MTFDLDFRSAKSELTQRKLSQKVQTPTVCVCIALRYRRVIGVACKNRDIRVSELLLTFRASQTTPLISRRALATCVDYIGH